MIYRRFIISVLIVFFVFNNLAAIETIDGYIRLTINEKSCGFSLYYLTDTFSEEAGADYEPLFSHRDPRTSFLAVSLNGKIYRLGESRYFRTRIERQGVNPAVVFESPYLLINEVFSPVRTANSPVANGVKITITVTNTGNMPSDVGLRMLIDTHLGERRGDIPFTTDNLKITGEKIIDTKSGETYWISRGERASLMGSIVNPPGVTARSPDYLHFANWKKLSDVPWKAPYYEGRSFNYTQYSVNDSAVCYYWEPVTFAEDESATYVIYLTTGDKSGFSDSQAQVAQESKREAIRETVVEYDMNYQENEDIITLQRLQGTLDKFVAGEISMNEHELAEIEQSIAIIKNKYNLTLR